MNFNELPNIRDGRKVVAAAGTAERLVSASTPAKRVTITALYGNTDMVVIGNSTVVAAAGTRRGIPLPGGASITLDTSDLYEIYLDAVVNGEGVSFIYQF